MKKSAPITPAFTKQEAQSLCRIVRSATDGMTGDLGNIKFKKAIERDVMNARLAIGKIMASMPREDWV